jgi:hypothetical protein
MKRLPQWENLLAAHFAKAHAQRFGWGTFDCALAVCDGINAITGIDPGAPYRGKYKTEQAATAIIGGNLGSFTAGVCQAQGFPEYLDKDGKTRPGFAHRGDVALIQASDPGLALGTVDLTGRFAWCASERGFIRVPMKFWLRAWKIA